MEEHELDRIQEALMALCGALQKEGLLHKYEVEFREGHAVVDELLSGYREN